MTLIFPSNLGLTSAQSRVTTVFMALSLLIPIPFSGVPDAWSERGPYLQRGGKKLPPFFASMEKNELMIQVMVKAGANAPPKPVGAGKERRRRIYTIWSPRSTAMSRELVQILMLALELGLALPDWLSESFRRRRRSIKYLSIRSKPVMRHGTLIDCTRETWFGRRATEAEMTTPTFSER